MTDSPSAAAGGRSDALDLLAAYDEQLRGNVEAAGRPSETDGPLIRIEYPDRDVVTYRSLEGLTDAELDALVIRQREASVASGRSLEWMARGHDLPADLRDRLVAAGFHPVQPSTVMVARSADIADRLSGQESPVGVTVRRPAGRADFERIAVMETAIWDLDWSWLADDLFHRRTTRPDLLDVYVAEAAGELVSAGWALHRPGTDFTRLVGGSTVADWRGRGVYKALVAVRAARAAEVGYRYLQVDASDDSAPILRRLGFVPLTTVTPYVFTPPAS